MHVEPKTVKESCSVLLLASGSYTVPFVIVSRIIGVCLVEKQPSHQSSWQANNTIAPEQNVFSEVHTIHNYI